MKLEPETVIWVSVVYQRALAQVDVEVIGYCLHLAEFHPQIRAELEEIDAMEHDLEIPIDSSGFLPL